MTGGRRDVFRRGCAGAAAGPISRPCLWGANAAPAAEVCKGRLIARPKACGAAEAVLGGLCAIAGAKAERMAIVCA